MPPPRDRPAAAMSRSSARRLFERVEGYLFIAPALLIIGVFGLYPTVFTLVVSLFNWRIRTRRFTGFGNFQRIFGEPEWFGLLLLGGLLALAAVMAGAHLQRTGRLSAATSTTRRWRAAAAGLWLAALTALAFALPAVWGFGDPGVWDSLRITVWYSLGTVPVQLLLGLIVAVLLDGKFRGKQAFRVIYLLPYIVPSVASAAVFERLFSLRPESFANQLLAAGGAAPLAWLGEARGVLAMAFGWGAGAAPAELAGAAGQLPVADYWGGWARGPSLALVSVMLYNHWVYVGYYALIYANGLANIPRELYEAAEVDGAPPLRRLWHITLPLLSPTTLFLALLGVIGTFKSFNSIYILRNNAARGSTDPLSIYIFDTFYQRTQYGYAAAIALVLLAVVLVITYMQRTSMEGGLHYGDE